MLPCHMTMFPFATPPKLKKDKKNQTTPMLIVPDLVTDKTLTTNLWPHPSNLSATLPSFPQTLKSRIW